MQRTLRAITGSLALVIAVSFFAMPVVRGEEPGDIITDVQLQAIRARCSELHASLNRVYQSDKVFRHDRGQLYRTVSDKLMVPLNQRIASNQLDGSGLVAVAAQYNATYDDFYEAYKSYEQALVKAMAINCTKNPTQFYDSVADAREKRIVLQTYNNKLVELASKYKSEFDIFRANQADEEKE